ncbi:4Fe-4S_ferredoxin iron-sulfur binding domain protein [Hexamita inflata]|uniref:4Fe-4S ferredoxin iron-sulfur binding domain protein n=1 Tax=Hexamita inflata TaxID=28002 RepID=A0AA86QHA3_9EUKA|nr:4Fe-4S ferredoxin iron-sulfur binding domain protein [Hexamita inflata]
MINQETNKQLTSKNYQYSNFDAYIVGCFTDCLVAPPYVLSYLNNYPQAFLKNKYVLTFNEHGGDGGSVQHNLHQLFLRNEAKPVSHIKINYCNNYIGLTYPKNELEIQGIKRDQLAQVHPKCVLYNNLLQNKAQYVFPKQSCGPRFGSFLTTPLFKKITNVMSMKYTVNDNCTGCSTCVDNCPQAIIELIEGKAAFTNEKRCIGCYLLRLPVQAEPNYQRDDHLAHAPLRSERSQRKSAAPRKGSSRKSVRPGFEINGGRRYATERYSGYRRTKRSKLHVSEGSWSQEQKQHDYRCLDCREPVRRACHHVHPDNQVQGHEAKAKPQEAGHTFQLQRRLHRYSTSELILFIVLWRKYYLDEHTLQQYYRNSILIFDGYY